MTIDIEIYYYNNFIEIYSTDRLLDIERSASYTDTDFRWRKKHLIDKYAKGDKIPQWIKDMDEVKKMYYMEETREGYTYKIPSGLRNIIDSLIEVDESINISHRETHFKVHPTTDKSLGIQTHLKLRPNQLKAFEAIKTSNYRGIVDAATGFGKTVLGIKTIQDTMFKALILIDKISIADEWLEKFKMFMPHLFWYHKNKFHFAVDKKHKTHKDAFENGNILVAVATPALIINVMKAVISRRRDVKPSRNSIIKLWITKQVNLLIYDECFPYETMITTEYGDMPIGYIVENKLKVKVLTHTGQWKQIIGHRSYNRHNELLKITHEYGELICTKDHQVLTKDGWINAQYLNNMDVMYFYEKNRDNKTKKIDINKNNTSSKTDNIRNNVRRRSYEQSTQNINKCKTKNKSFFKTTQISNVEIFTSEESCSYTSSSSKKWRLWRPKLTVFNEEFTDIDGFVQNNDGRWEKESNTELVEYDRSPNSFGCVDDGRLYQSGEVLFGKDDARRRDIISKLDEEEMEYKQSSLHNVKRTNTLYLQEGRERETDRISEALFYTDDELQIGDIVYDLTVEDNHSYVANNIVVHNCHHAASPRAVSVLDSIDTLYKLGFSATPMKRTKGDDLEYVARIGSIVYTLKNYELHDMESIKLIFKPVRPIAYSRTTSFRETIYPEAIIYNDERNDKIAEIIFDNYDKDRSVLVLVDKIAHAQEISLITGFPHTFAGDKSRFDKFERFNSREQPVLICTYALAGEGYDNEELETVIMAGGGVSPIKVIQGAGRALRKKKGKNEIIIYEFADTTIKLRDQTLKRLNIYIDEKIYDIRHSNTFIKNYI
jgi:superfamily II DNA or RNA helicase/intein/homing endonuclease